MKNYYLFFAAVVLACSGKAQPTLPMGAVSSASPAVTSDAGHSGAFASAVVSVTPLPLLAPTTNEEECQQRCNGKWGPQGLRQRDACLCRTKDVGKDCRDAADCEGPCVMYDLRHEVTDPGPPAKGFFVGKCFEFAKPFGCLRLIAKGTRAKGPVEISEPPSVLCID